MRSIGETARDSGLGVSALRFYDRAGVLVPARVDPGSGYRWYAPEQVAEARVLARLRRAGMPLADIRLVLAGWSAADGELVAELLRTHLRRLERSLSDARAEFSALRALLASRENLMPALRTATVRPAAAGLSTALDAVRFAVGTDPELPVLGGVLFDLADGVLRVVATDRYRLAVAETAVAGYDGPPVRAVVPAPLVDAMRALLGGEGSVALTVDGDQVALEAGDRRTAGACLGHDFPDYRRLVRLPAGRRVLVDVPAFADAVRRGPVRPGGADDGSREVSVLKVTDDGSVAVCGDEDRGEEDAAAPVGVDRRFLLDALAAGGRSELVVEFGAPTAPLAVRRPDDEGTFSLLMPVRLED